MSSLWTPDGERRVERVSPDVDDRRASFTHSATSAEAETLHGRAPSEGPASDEESYREELERLEAELLRSPAGDIIANHCYGMFQLAALHLGQTPPNLEEAKLAIDALAAVIEALGPRIGGTASTLGEGLAQIQLAFVQISAASRASGNETFPSDG